MVLQLRPDKYSKKTFKYFVEYSDKESKKKTTIESETRKETQEAPEPCPHSYPT